MLLHLQPACCCRHLQATEPSMTVVSTPPFERLSDYVDAPKPNQEQFQEYFNMQKASTSVTTMKQDYLHVQHNQPAGFTTLCPTVALRFSKCANSGDTPPSKKIVIQGRSRKFRLK